MNGHLKNTYICDWIVVSDGGIRVHTGPDTLCTFDAALEYVKKQYKQSAVDRLSYVFVTQSGERIDLSRRGVEDIEDSARLLYVPSRRCIEI